MDGLGHCFRPLDTLLTELDMSMRWQFGNIVEQLEYWKGKAQQQRETLSKLGAELKHARALKL